MSDQEKKESQETGVIVSSGENRVVNMWNQSETKNALLYASSVAASDIIPYHYQRKPENVLVAMYRSNRLGIDVFAYMEVTYPVNGKLGHEAKFITSLINNSKKFTGCLKYVMSGEIKRGKDSLILSESTRKCTAWAIEKETGERLEQSVEISLAILSGWATKNGSDKTPKTNQWQTMPDQKLQYSAAKFFGNMYCPELVMGLNTKEELEDVSDAEVIDQTETGRAIFTKGEDISTEADPVLDPTKEIKAEPVVATVVETKQEVIHEKIHEKTPELPIQKTFVELSEKPPEDVQEFTKWFQLKFASESSTVDAFLVSKKWLKTGQGFPSLTYTQLKKMREVWDSFKNAYKTYREAQK